MLSFVNSLNNYKLLLFFFNCIFLLFNGFDMFIRFYVLCNVNFFITFNFTLVQLTKQNTRVDRNTSSPNADTKYLVRTQIIRCFILWNFNLNNETEKQIHDE